MRVQPGYARHRSVVNLPGKLRNGGSVKTVTSDLGEVDITVPGDRQGSFEPKLVPKRQRRFPGIDNCIFSLYARGITTREIAAHLEEIFGAEVSPTLISTIMDTVADEVRAWQAPARGPVSRTLPRLPNGRKA